MRELNDIRQDINAVDEEIRSLFLQRMELAREVAACKAQTNDRILKPEREAEIIERRAAGVSDALRHKYTALLQSIMRASREYQYSELLLSQPGRFPVSFAQTQSPAKCICYQGLPGAYQELAAQALFPDCASEPVETWEKVFQKVRDGQYDYGVVPVENSTAGSVNEVYDLLLAYDLSINRSHIKKIQHCLAGVPGTTLSTIRTVCSHPHALPQCRNYIAAHGFTTCDAPNTAMAAQRVHDEGDTSLAAICSREAAARYGLTVLAENINDLQHNETRFIAVSRQLTVLPEDNYVEIVFHLPNVSGSLSSVLALFADYNVNMTDIHSRPIKDSPWSYVFYIDFTGNLNDHPIRSLIWQLYEELPDIKVIGSYHVTLPETD